MHVNQVHALDSSRTPADDDDDDEEIDDDEEEEIAAPRGYPN